MSTMADPNKKDPEIGLVGIKGFEEEVKPASEPVKSADVSITFDTSEGFFGNLKTFWISVLRAEKPATVVVTPDDYKQVGPLAGIASYIDNTFRITERGSSYYFEFTGGMTTFFSMCYIMVLNGVIIGGTGISKNGIFFATTVSAGIFTFIMGLFVNIPVALAPGMGLNGYFATVASTCSANPTGSLYGVECPGWGKSSLPWSDAMGAVFLSGWIYLFLTLTGLRSMLFKAVPDSMRHGITAGIGFFITMIGLNIGSITRVTLANWALSFDVISQAECKKIGGFCPNNVDLDFTYYSLGMVRYNFHPAARIAVLGLVIASGLEALKVKGSIIIAIVLSTLVGINYVHCTSVRNHDDGCVTKLSLWGQNGGPEWIVNVSDIPSGWLSFRYADTSIFWESVFTFLFVEMFDSFGTLSGLMERCGFLKGDPEVAMARVNRGMCVDGLGLWLGGIIGANSITCYVESNTGVEAGARTGVASLVTGSAFLLSLLFVQPFVSIIPDPATTCALVMVGVHSISALKEIDFSKFTDKLTAFFTIATMGFTYSIANGIAVAFIFNTWLVTLQFVVMWCKKKVYADNQEEMPKLPHFIMYCGAVFSVFRFAYLGDFARSDGIAPV